MAFSTDRFILSAGSGHRKMKATANRYRPMSRQWREKDEGFILMFAHGTGFHKEIWEPTLEHLFANDRDSQSDDSTRILEAWTIDCQNHGEAALLNNDVFVHNPNMLTIHDYAEAFACLCQSGLLGYIQKGVKKIALIGHSAGATAAVFATGLFGTPSEAPFDMVILVDPAIYPPEMMGKMTDTYKIVAKTTASRRSIWESKEAAHAWLKSRSPWKLWDQRVLKLYTEHGLRTLPTPFHDGKEGVVLSCDPAHEAAAFTTHRDDTPIVLAQFTRASRIIPFHGVYGARNDMFSREVQDSLHDPSVGRVLASVWRVKEAGHLVPLEKPGNLAEILKQVLATGKRRVWKNLNAPKL